MKIPVIMDLEPKKEAYIPLLLLSSDPAYELKAVTFSPKPEDGAEAEALKALISSLGVRTCEEGQSVRLMAEAVSDGGQTVLVVCGSLSNAAALLLAQPELKEKLRCISFAGGSFRGGDASVAAERNVYADPEALDVVLRSGVKTFMAPLELSDALSHPEAVLPSAYLKNFGLSEGLHYGRVLRNISAALAPAHPELFQARERYVETELSGAFSRGATVADFKNQLEREANVSVLEGLDKNALSHLLSGLLAACEQEGKR